MTAHFFLLAVTGGNATFHHQRSSLTFADFQTAPHINHTSVRHFPYNRNFKREKNKRLSRERLFIAVFVYH